jgi:succinate dehydrogenase hydrophobic anchor subunit
MNSARLLIQRRAVGAFSPGSSPTSRLLSSTKILNADSGPLATRIHHGMTTFLLVATPVYFVLPDRWTDDTISGKLMEMSVSTVIVAHSWIGLNYVATDYVPKISKALLPPARIANAGMAVVTLLGLFRITLGSNSPGGLKGVVKGLWKREPKRNIYDF